MVTFAEPDALWLLAGPAAASALVLLRHRRRQQQQRRLASPGVWDRLMGGSPATGLVRMACWCAAAALVALALARPQWGELPGEESVRTRDLVVALDVSDSMLCPDQPPTRLGRALEVIQRALPVLEGNRMAVVVFAGDAYPLVPLTKDLAAVAAFLDGVRPQMVALPGSNLERAVAAALDLLPAEGEGRVLVLVTDGENLQGDVAAAARRLGESGAGVLAVLAGTTHGGPIPLPEPDGGVRYKRDESGQPVVTRARPEVLAELADEVDGEVLSLSGEGAVHGLVDAVERLRTREVETTRAVRRIERFPIFLVAAAVVLWLGFAASPWRRLAITGLLVVFLLPATTVAQEGAEPTAGQPTSGQRASGPPPASAVSWWQRWVPGGSRRLARSGVAHWQDQELQPAIEDFAAAAELDPDDPDRLYDLGTAAAAAGDLETGIPVLGAAHERGAAAAAYNGGTASLIGGQPELAVRLLRQALLRNPDDSEAKRNYELALRMLEEQQQQQQPQQQEQQQQQPQERDEESTPQPTPTPQPGQPQPTPTPSSDSPLFAALDRAEAEAREQMRSPTPAAATVEKDW